VRSEKGKLKIINLVGGGVKRLRLVLKVLNHFLDALEMKVGELHVIGKEGAGLVRWGKKVVGGVQQRGSKM